jgi:putative flippase GtrA
VPVSEEKQAVLGGRWAGMLLRRLSAFGLVGAAAGLVHFAVGLTLVWTGVLGPFMANLCAFLCAFWVSYFGHYRWSFASERQHRVASRRFFVTAAIGFLINQAGVYLLVYQFGVPYPLALVVTFTLVAANTLLLGWLWVF